MLPFCGARAEFYDPGTEPLRGPLPLVSLPATNTAACSCRVDLSLFGALVAAPNRLTALVLGRLHLAGLRRAMDVPLGTNFLPRVWTLHGRPWPFVSSQLLRELVRRCSSAAG